MKPKSCITFSQKKNERKMLFYLTFAAHCVRHFISSVQTPIVPKWKIDGWYARHPGKPKKAGKVDHL